MRKYRVSTPCRACDGGGSADGGTDKDGYPTRVNCRWCYRGTITIVLTEADVRPLIRQLEEIQ